VPVSLKWPNDLLVAGGRGGPRKLSGILVDDVASPTFGRAAVAGIGVNVRFDRGSLPEELRDRVASLSEFVSPTPDLDAVEEVVVRSATEAAEWLSSSGGAERSRELCRTLLYGVGRPVRVDGRPAGTIETLGDEGELWLATAGDRVAVWAGDVRVEEER
jgi:biotin-(acetyl-CoA carboxylase) ligase